MTYHRYICINIVWKIHSELVYVGLAHNYMQRIIYKTIIYITETFAEVRN